MAIQVQTRNGASATWTLNDPILAQGEIGYETDTGKMKYGNGVTEWINLAYFAGEEFGGVIFDPLHQYTVGDIVSYNGSIYSIGEDPTNPGFPPPAGTLPGDAEWPMTGTNRPVGPEQGGVIWAIDVDYKIGDTVTSGRELFVSNTDHTSSSSFSGDSVNWDTSISQSSVISEAGLGNTSASDRISNMISLTQTEYDLIGSKQSDCLYIIVG